MRGLVLLVLTFVALFATKSESILMFHTRPRQQSTMVMTTPKGPSLPPFRAGALGLPGISFPRNFDLKKVKTFLNWIQQRNRALRLYHR